MIEVLFLGKKETVDNSFEDVEFRDLTFWGGYEGWNGKVMSKCKVNTNRLKWRRRSRIQDSRIHSWLDLSASYPAISLGWRCLVCADAPLLPKERITRERSLNGQKRFSLYLPGPSRCLYVHCTSYADVCLWSTSTHFSFPRVTVYIVGVLRCLAFDLLIYRGQGCMRVDGWMYVYLDI